MHTLCLNTNTCSLGLQNAIYTQNPVKTERFGNKPNAGYGAGVARQPPTRAVPVRADRRGPGHGARKATGAQTAAGIKDQQNRDSARGRQYMAQAWG